MPAAGRCPATPGRHRASGSRSAGSGRRSSEGSGGEPAVHVGDGSLCCFGVGATDRRALAARPAPGARSTTRRCGATGRDRYRRRRLALIAAGRLPSGRCTSWSGSASLLVTRAAYYSHEAGGFYTLFYVWIGLYAVFFFSRLVALLYLSAIAVAYGVPADRRPTPARAGALDHDDRRRRPGAFLIDSLVRRVRRLGAEVGRDRQRTGRADGDPGRGRAHRRPHRAAEPPRLGRGASSASWRGPSATRRRSASGSWTSTGSSSTTTTTATRRATGC